LSKRTDFWKLGLAEYDFTTAKRLAVLTPFQSISYLSRRNPDFLQFSEWKEESEKHRQVKEQLEKAERQLKEQENVLNQLPVLRSHLSRNI
jgi:hypothetical protein